MTKRIIAIISLLCLMMCLAGCKVNLRDTVEGGQADVPAFDLSSDLIGKVTAIYEGRCTVTVLEDNSHYDKDDVIYVTYTPEDDGITIRVGDIIRAHYDYITQVSSVASIPHITTGTITVLQDYTPPETTEATE